MHRNFVICMIWRHWLLWQNKSLRRNIILYNTQGISLTGYLIYTACPILVFGKTPHAHASQNPRHRTCLTPPPGHRTRMLESQKQICRIPICASPHNITQIKTKQLPILAHPTTPNNPNPTYKSKFRCENYYFRRN